MQPIVGFLKGVFNFFVGDWIILAGIVLTVVLVGVLESLILPESLKILGGYLFILGVILTLLVTLRRETREQK